MAGNSNQVMALEQFVESTTFLPSEMQRLLKLIRELDDKARGLVSDVQADVTRCLSLVPQSSWKSPNGDQYKEVAELRQSIEKRQRMLVQIGEEKVQLAIQGYELVQKHSSDLKEDLKREFAEEENQQAAENAAPEVHVAPPAPEVSIHPPRRPTLPVGGSKKMAEKKVSEKRMREKPEPELPLPVKAMRRQESVQHVQHLQQLASAPSMGTLNNEEQAFESLLSEAGGMEFDTGIGIPSAIEGLEAASPNLQAAGRLLTHADIAQELKGRHAELFWPDDNLWYVITIHEINPMAKTAKIMYTTGETEELDLNEIVRESHMSLINLM